MHPSLLGYIPLTKPLAHGQFYLVRALSRQNCPSLAHLQWRGWTAETSSSPQLTVGASVVGPLWLGWMFCAGSGIVWKILMGGTFP